MDADTISKSAAMPNFLSFSRLPSLNRSNMDAGTSRRKKPPKLGSLKLHRSGSTPLRLLTPEPPAKADGRRQKAEECLAKPWEGRREGILRNRRSHLNTSPN